MIVHDADVYRVSGSRALRSLPTTPDAPENALFLNYRFPLTVDQRIGAEPPNYAWTVQAQETITVPAGLFSDCSRLAYVANTGWTRRWFVAAENNGVTPGFDCMYDEQNRLRLYNPADGVSLIIFEENDQHVAVRACVPCQARGAKQNSSRGKLMSMTWGPARASRSSRLRHNSLPGGVTGELSPDGNATSANVAI